MSQRESFIFYRSFYEAFIPLSDGDKVGLFNAITEYALNGNDLEMTPLVKAMFALIKPQLSANNKKYENGVKGKEYGKLGGRPKKKNPKITPKGFSGITPNVNENDNVNDIKENKEKFCSEEFRVFWNEYPLKIKKAEAMKAYHKSVMVARPDEILKGLEKYKLNKPAYADWAHASSWLNGRRWDDDFLPANDPAKPAKVQGVDFL